MNEKLTLEDLLGEYYAREEHELPEKFIARHPDHADALREHFALGDLLEHAFAPQSALPASIGPFRIETELGVGGMGTVYRAVVAQPVRGIETGRTVALKVVHPHLFRTPGFFKRFLREADLGRRIEHPNVVRTLDADAVEIDDRTQHYLVMEYVEGQTLRDVVEDVDRVPEELARHVGCEVAKALSAIHAAGAVHRDLKPENVLITADQTIKVMDLGVARLADEQVRLSQTGAFVGSLSYAAPEQFGGGKHVDARADLHGLGILLYEIATGVSPFADEDARAVMRRILADPPRKAGELNPQLSPFFEELLAQLLEKDPADRFDSADDVLTILDKAEQSPWWRARAKEIRATSKRPLRRIRVPRETAVYGRDAELARLRSLYDVADSGDGRVVLVEGEAGIGKTRLVDEFVAQLQQAGEELNFLFASYPPGGAATASGAFSAAYREHLGAEGLEEALAELLTQTPVLIPAFAAILRGDAPPAGTEPLTKDSLQTCFVHLTRNLAAERTTIVLIDDLHFAPEDGRALFASVALAVPSRRILLIGTMRPGVPEEWTAGMTRLDQTSHLPVPRLGPKDLVRLLSDSFRSERLAEELAGKIAVKSDGNPFFAFEIIRGLREGQFITQRDDGSWHTTRLIEDIQVPSSVLDLVNARVADLGDDDRILLDVAACWGYEFDPSLIAAAVERPRLSVLQRLAQIEKRDRLVRSCGRAFAFDHHQVQEALYGALPAMLREEYHAMIASTLESRSGAAERQPEELNGDLCVHLCEHFFRGGSGHRALRYLSATLTHLARGHLDAKAIELGRRALSTKGLLKGSDRAALLVRLCRGDGPLKRLVRIDELSEFVLELEALAESLDDTNLRLAAAKGLADCHLHRHELKECTAALFRARSLAKKAGDRRAEILVLKALGDLYRRASRFSDARSVLEEALDLFQASDGSFRELPDPRPNLGAALAEQGKFDEADRCFQGYLTAARAAGEAGEEAFALGQIGVLRWCQERLSEARSGLAHQIAHARSTGWRSEEMVAVGNLAGLLSELGLLSEAEAASERHEELARETGSVFEQVMSNVKRGSLCLRRGDLPEARQRLEKALASAREHGLGWLQAQALYALAAAADEEGDLDASLRLADEALSLRRELHHGLTISDSLVQVGGLLCRTGPPERARATLEEALSNSREQKKTESVALVLAMLARLPGGEIQDARRAVAALSAPSPIAMHARLLLWEAERLPSDLAEAKRLSDELLVLTPSERREAVLRCNRVHREIQAASREEFGEDRS